MPLVTCGLADEGVIAGEVRFSTTPELILFSKEMVEEGFWVKSEPKEFSTEIKVINFEIDLIRIEECSFPI